MSKLLAMMMMRKPQYMNLSVVGSPTINNGVASGFASSSDYICTNNTFDTSQDFEIVVKANTGTSNGTLLRNNYGDTAGDLGINIGLSSSSKKLYSYIITTSGHYVSNGAQGTTVLEDNTDYFIKFSQIGNIFKLEISTNGINWITENTWSYNERIRNSGQGIAFGGGNLNITGSYWHGSIDLYNSYIKINNTKYKFQFTMPLTVVGSPTIADGIVSGFSASDYIADNNTFDITSNFEICVKINSWEATGSTQYFLSLRGNKNLNLYFGSGGSGIACYYGSYWYDIATNLETGTPIKVIVKGNGTDITITVIQGNYSNTSSKSISEIGLSGDFVIHFGKGGATLPFTSGYIDMYSSYIIDNGTKYIFTLPQS